MLWGKFAKIVRRGSGWGMTRLREREREREGVNVWGKGVSWGVGDQEELRIKRGCKKV